MRTIGSCVIRAGAERARALPRHRLRRVIGPITLVVFVFGQCASAMATSTKVTLHLKVVPIPVNPAKPKGPSYADTGNVLEKGAAVEGDVQIHGGEYGFLSPLAGVSVFAPAGLKLHSQGFPVCSLVSTVPEEPYAVVESAHLEVGAAYEQGSRLIPYVTLPRHCAKGGLPVRVKLSFLIGGPVQIDTRLPCPTKR